MFIILHLLFLLPSVALAEDVTEHEVRDKITDALKTICKYTCSQKEEALIEARKLIDELDRHIIILEERLEQQWNKMDESTRKKTSDSLRNLRAKRNKISEYFGELKQSSSSAWEHVRKGFVNSFEALNESMKRAQKEF